MSNERSLRELKIFRELSCNAANHQRNQKKLKKEGAYLNLVFFILIKLYKKLLLELKLYRKLRLELKKHSLKQEFDKKNYSPIHQAQYLFVLVLQAELVM